MSRPVTLITGASSGIGKVFAERLAKEGHDLILVARRQAELEALSEKLQGAHGITAHVLPMDLARQEAPRLIFEEVSKRGLMVEGLINNAGFGMHGALEANDALELERMLQLNVMALTMLTRLFLPGMLERHSGTIVNVASTASFQPNPMFAAYSASKAYVLSFSEAIAVEVRDRGVKVVALCPGPTKTEFAETAKFSAGLFPDAIWMTAEAVVEEGMKAIRLGKVVQIPGALNAAMARVVPFVPRPLLTQITRRLFQPEV